MEFESILDSKKCESCQPYSWPFITAFLARDKIGRSALHDGSPLTVSPTCHLFFPFSLSRPLSSVYLIVRRRPNHCFQQLTFRASNVHELKWHRISGQTKQIFGRNTETETRLPGKAEISAETEILAKTVYFGRNSLFRLKCFVSDRTIYGYTPDFLPKSGPKHVFLAKRDYSPYRL